MNQRYLNLPGRSLWARGFRPFFLGASVLSILSMCLWLAVYLFQPALPIASISILQWHAHEMIFGYAMAVIAGFLLTAASNWTGRETAHGVSLFLLFTPWLIARLMMLSGTGLVLYAGLADLIFMLGLFIAVARPIVAVRQKRQTPVLLILALLTTANLLFYIGAMGWQPDAARIGIYGGLYLVIGMVLFMGRRVIPLFTRGGVGYQFEPGNTRWNDIATFMVYPLFLVSEVFFSGQLAGSVLAACLFVLNSLRLAGWYTPGIWRKPLLWSLFAALTMITIGFLMRAMTAVYPTLWLLSVHAFAVGGIGIVTLSMMIRVTLGHTGRNVHNAPPLVLVILTGMILSACLRVFLPLINPGHYRIWIGASGLAWVISFALFALVVIPMLMRPRIDGKPG